MRFNEIAVSPVLFCILDIVVKIELIHAVDIVEIPFPWNVIRLCHTDGLSHLHLSLPNAFKLEKNFLYVIVL